MPGLSSILGLFAGQNPISFLADMLTVGGGVIAKIDANDTGTDDLIADVAVATGQALNAWQHGTGDNIRKACDAGIAALQTLKANAPVGGSYQDPPVK